MKSSFYPSPSELLTASADKRVLLHVQRSFLSVMSHGLSFLFFLIIVIAINYLFPDARVPLDMPVIKDLSPRWLAIFPAFFLVEMLRKYHDDLYIFGKHRLTHLNGRLSLNYSIPVVKYSDIRGITVRRDIAGRIFGYGTVEIGTAAMEGAELEIMGVRHPYDLAELIDALRCHSRDLLLMKQAYEEKGQSIDIGDQEDDGASLVQELSAGNAAR